MSDALYADAEMAPYLRALPRRRRSPATCSTARPPSGGSPSISRSRRTEAFGAFSRLELDRGGRVHHLCGAHAARRAAAAVAADARGGGRDADDRRGDARQPRTDAHARPASGAARLLAAIDRTVTSAGARLLAQRLAAPLTDPARSRARLDAVAVFVDDAAARADVREQLAAAPDLARALARLVLGRGGPRDLAAIRDGLVAADGDRRGGSARCRTAGRDRAAAAGAARAPDRASSRRWRRRSPTSCRTSSATAASCAPATTPRSTRRVRCATNRAASSPRCRRATPTRPACAR